LADLWHENQYYLGEWHYHPSNLPSPSKTDIDQMNSVSSTPKFNCPEPILIIAGDINHEFVLSMQIFIKDKMIRLIQSNDE
jgi:hypothetical protein